MKPEYEGLALVKNEANQRFELTVDSHTAFIDYQQDATKSIRLIHTESPEALAGRGVATALIEKTLTYLEENTYQLVPLCPLVFAYIKRHPKWIRIVREDFKSRLEK